MLHPSVHEAISLGYVGAILFTLAFPMVLVLYIGLTALWGLIADGRNYFGDRRDGHEE